MDHYKQHFTYPSSNNEDVIHVTVWQPMKPRAIVQICHGMCEYVERYDEFAQFLNCLLYTSRCV